MPTSRLVTVLLGVVVLLAAALGGYMVTRLDHTGPTVLPTADMDWFPETDPALIRYREAEPIKTGLEEVRALAVGPKDRIYVAAGRTVQVFDSGGARLSELKTSAEPRCLAVAKDGTVYLGMLDHVAVYGPDGKFRAAWKSLGKKAIITSVAAGTDDVFVADAGNLIVLRYDRAGKILNTIGKKDPGRNIDGFLVPSPYFDVAVGPDGQVRVSNPGRLRVEVYTPQGGPLAVWGRGSKDSTDIEGFAGCCNPCHLALLPDGGVVTSEKGFARVKVFTKEGRFDGVVAGPESFRALSCPIGDCTKGKTLDLAVDGKGRVLVLDPSSGDVRVFVRDERPRI